MGRKKKFAGFPNPLNEERNIILFLLWGGAIATLVNSIWSPTVLLYFGGIGFSEYFITMGTWWTGDFVGVAVAAPILLVWTKPGQGDWQRRAFAVTGCIALAFSITVIIVAANIDWQRQRLQLQFQSVADLAGASITEAFKDHAEVLQYYEGFAATSPDFSRQDFAQFSERFLANFESLTALTWQPYIRHSERYYFEAKMQAAGYQDYQIVQPDAEGKMVPAETRADYVPVKFVEPFEPNKISLGFDVGSHPARRIAFEKAIETGDLVATQRIKLILKKTKPKMARLPICHL